MKKILFLLKDGSIIFFFMISILVTIASIVLHDYMEKKRCHTPVANKNDFDDFAQAGHINEQSI